MLPLKPMATLGSVLIGAALAGLAGGLCGMALKSQLNEALSTDNRPQIAEVAVRPRSAVDAWVPTEGAPPPPEVVDETPTIQASNLDVEIRTLLRPPNSADPRAGRAERSSRPPYRSGLAAPADDPDSGDADDRGRGEPPPEPAPPPAEHDALY